MSSIQLHFRTKSEYDSAVECGFPLTMLVQTSGGNYATIQSKPVKEDGVTKTFEMRNTSSNRICHLVATDTETVLEPWREMTPSEMFMDTESFSVSAYGQTFPLSPSVIGNWTIRLDYPASLSPEDIDLGLDVQTPREIVEKAALTVIRLSVAHDVLGAHLRSVPENVLEALVLAYIVSTDGQYARPSQGGHTALPAPAQALYERALDLARDVATFITSETGMQTGETDYAPVP